MINCFELYLQHAVRCRWSLAIYVFHPNCSGDRAKPIAPLYVYVLEIVSIFDAILIQINGNLTHQIPNPTLNSFSPVTKNYHNWWLKIDESSIQVLKWYMCIYANFQQQPKIHTFPVIKKCFGAQWPHQNQDQCFCN